MVSRMTTSKVDAPERIWLSAANDDNEREVWTDPCEGGTDYVRADIAARILHEALGEFQQLTGDHQDLEAIASSHALSLTDELARRRKAEAECDRLAAELAEAQAALQRAAGRAAWERHRARMALRAFDVQSAKSAVFKDERDRLIEEAARKDAALRWYESEALGAEKAMVGGKPSPDVALAVLTVLALDCGQRARAALEQEERR